MATQERTNRLPTTVAVAASMVAAVLLCFACGGSAEPEAPAASTAGSISTGDPHEQPEQVARAFLDAYGGFNTEQALAYLTDGAVASGIGHGGGWGDAEGFRLDVALAEAQGIRQMLTGCEGQPDGDGGTTVHCTFDMHAFRSDEIGRGPFGDNYWDIVVRDGKVTSAVATWSFLTNGFSSEMWQPFQAWITNAHPLDVQVMYLGGNAALTEESIALWDERLAEWAAKLHTSSP